VTGPHVETCPAQPGLLAFHTRTGSRVILARDAPGAPPHEQVLARAAVAQHCHSDVPHPTNAGPDDAPAPHWTKPESNTLQDSSAQCPSHAEKRRSADATARGTSAMSYRRHGPSYLGQYCQTTPLRDPNILYPYYRLPRLRPITRRIGTQYNTPPRRPACGAKTMGFKHVESGPLFGSPITPLDQLNPPSNPFREITGSLAPGAPNRETACSHRMVETHTWAAHFLASTGPRLLYVRDCPRA